MRMTVFFKKGGLTSFFPQKSKVWTDVGSWDRHTWWRSKKLWTFLKKRYMISAILGKQFKGLFILTSLKKLKSVESSLSENDATTTNFSSSSRCAYYFYSKEEGRLVSPLIKSRWHSRRWTILFMIIIINFSDI